MPDQRMILAFHHGPLTPGCPVECLRTVLSNGSWNPLARAYDAPFSPPRTVGDVVELFISDRLRDIRNLGRRRISEVETALVFAGFDLRGHSLQPGKAPSEHP